jgi:hypothetical protein
MLTLKPMNYICSMKKVRTTVSRGMIAKHLQWLRMEPRLLTVINELIQADWCRLFEVSNGIIYLVVEHWKYLDLGDAKRLKIAHCNGASGKYYITEQITV